MDKGRIVWVYSVLSFKEGVKLAVQSVRDYISWTLFGGIIGLLIGSFFNWLMWGAIVGAIVGFLGALWSNIRYKKEQEKYKV